MILKGSCLGQLSKTFQWQSMMKKLDRLIKWRYSKLLKQSRWEITIHKNPRKVNPNLLKVNHRAEYNQHLRNREAGQGNPNHRVMLIRCYLVVESSNRSDKTKLHKPKKKHRGRDMIVMERLAQRMIELLKALKLQVIIVMNSVGLTQRSQLRLVITHLRNYQMKKLKLLLCVYTMRDSKYLPTIRLENWWKPKVKIQKSKVMRCRERRNSKKLWEL